jgi:very-short-patch-repair endonuclease
MNVSPDVLVDRTASSQAGCISRAQAFAAGYTDDMIGHRLRSQRWCRAYQGVYVLACVPPSWLQHVWSAVLAASRPSATLADVAVTHESALLVQGVEPSRLPRYPVSLTVPNGRHPRVKGAVVHQIDDLAPNHLIDVDGLPVASPDRAIVDVSANLGRVHLGSLLDELVAAGHVTYPEVSRCLADVARPGKPGIATLGRVLDDRGPGHVPGQSELEQRLFDLIREAGLPEPIRQFPLPGRHPRNELVDAAFPEAMVLVEVDGRRWHSRIADLRRDHARDAEAHQAGWVTLRFTYEQITTTPSDVAATIAAVLATRLTQLGHCRVPALP